MAANGIPSTREFTIVGICYGLYVFGLFMVWPAVIGVILVYVWRDNVRGTVLESHYRWLARTFWWWAIAWALILGVMIAIVLPHAVALGEMARSDTHLSIPWEMIVTAIVGGTLLLIVWLWVAIRLFRGTLRLADGSSIA